MTQIRDLSTHPEKFVTVPELADYWHVSVRTVYYHAQKGALKSTRIGRALRILTVDAQAFGRPEEVVSAPIASVR